MVTVADDVVVKLTAELSGLQKGMATGAAAVEGVEKKLAASAARMRVALAGLGVGAAVTGYVKQAEGWRGVRNQLLVSGVAVEQLDAKLNDLFAVAQKHGADIGSLSTLYGRLSQSAGELGASESQMLKFVDGVASALRVQGSSAEKASGALLQLSQAMGGAKVEAEEYNSISDGARPILQAVANGLEAAGGSVSKLRALVRAGELSSRSFFQAFLKGAGSIEAMAARSEATVGQSMVRLQNSFTRFVGRIDGGSKASGNLGDAIDLLSEKLNDPKFAEGAANALAGLVRLAHGLAVALGEVEYQIGRIGKFGPPGLGRLDAIAEKHRAAQEALLQAGMATERSHSRAKHGIRGRFVLPPDLKENNNSEDAATIKQQHQAIKDLIADLQFENSLLGQSALQQELAANLRRLGAGATAAQAKEVERLTRANFAGHEAAQQLADLEQFAAGVRDQYGDGTQSAAEQQERLNSALRAGLISLQEFQKAMEDATKDSKLEEFMERWKQIGETIESDLAGAFTDMAFNMENAREILAGLIEDIGKLIAKELMLQAVKGITGAIFGDGGLGGALAGAVGARALGGLVNAGNPYVVGEGGPELFVPRVSGQIVPGGRVGGGSFVFHSTINAGAGVNRSEIEMLLVRQKQEVSRMVGPIVKEHNARGRLRLGR